MESFLRNNDLFNKLPDEILVEMSNLFTSHQLEAGEILFHQGDPGDSLLLVTEGEISIFAPIEGEIGNEKPIRVFGPGEILGEMSIIDDQPRSLSARAEKPATVLALDQQEFKRLLRDHPDMSISVMAGLSDRIRYTTDFLNEVRQWVRRVSSGSYQTGQISERSDDLQNETIAVLAAEFAQMATRVQEREDELRKQVFELQIEIDEAKRRQEVEEILDSEFYRDLKEKAKSMKKGDK